MTTEPTDAELKAMWQLHAADIGGIFYYTRAVLAKWGNPAPVGAEPIGYLYCGGSYGDELADWEIVADQHQCDKLNEHHGSLGKEAKLPIYTTPQPTQPQAGAVPLTDEQMAKLYRQSAMRERIVVRGDWEQGVRDAEAAHGIKGGQQPTHAQAGAMPLDEARRLFDAGWKAAARFCDRDDVVADGIIGAGACPQFMAAFHAARTAQKEWEKQ